MDANIKHIVVFVVSLVCLGCATTTSLTIPKAELDVLMQTSPIYMRMDEPSSFEDRVKAAGPGGVLGVFGALGASVAVTSSSIKGKSLETELNIPDPSIRVKGQFQEVIKSRYSKSQIIDQTTPFDRSSMAKSKGVFFVFKTTLQGLFCYPNGCDYARAGYGVRAELYSSESSSPVWSSDCKAFRPEGGAMYTKQRMLENGGTMLKENLLRAADSCAESLLGKLFSDVSSNYASW
jgi:hypothetical protein